MNEPIFISFATDDRKVAETILTALEQRGLSCWIATRNISPGENFQEAITRAIRSAKVMILVFSAHSNNSLDVKKEIALAGRYNVVVVPVRVEDVVPSDALTYELAVRQWIDMFDDWEHAIERLIGQLKMVIDAEPTADGAAAAPGPIPVTPMPKRRALIPVLAGVLAVLVIGGAGLAWKFWPERHAEAPARPPQTPVAQTPPVPMQAATPAPASQPAPAAPALAPAATPSPQPAALAGGSTFRDCPNCPEMVVVPTGRFQMGANTAEIARFPAITPQIAEHEHPQHQVTIAKSFALAKFDVTRGEFSSFVAAANFHPPRGCGSFVNTRWIPRPDLNWDAPGFSQTDRDPVVCASGAEIEAYLEWLRKETGKPYRLASDAEWEYAARGGTVTAYYWGDDPTDVCAYENIADLTAKERSRDPGMFVMRCRDGFAETAPVGSFKPNPFGLYDMLGNVFVFTADCWNDSYVGAPSDGSVWNSGDCSRRVMRKASFANGRPFSFRAAMRTPEPLMTRSDRVGFRVALTLP
jgi:sulfatase modifying factor 1